MFNVHCEALVPGGVAVTVSHIILYPRVLALAPSFFGTSASPVSHAKFLTFLWASSSLSQIIGL